MNVFLLNFNKYCFFVRRINYGSFKMILVILLFLIMDIKIFFICFLDLVNYINLYFL